MAIESKPPRLVRALEPEIPADPDAERALLGCLLEDADALGLVDTIIQAEDFYIEAHRHIYAACQATFESGGVPDWILVAQAMPRDALETIGGVAGLSELTTATPTTRNLVAYARKIAALADKRRLAHDLPKHVMLAYEDGLPALDAIERIQADLMTLTERIFHRETGDGASILSASALRSIEFPDPHLIVAGIIPEGLTILGGRPKMGKSWLALNLALSVASGGPALGYTSTEQGDVLYLALEDVFPRLQTRIQSCMGDAPWPEALDLAVSCPRLDAGGLLYIERWIRHKQQPRMVIVDTLAKVRPEATGEHVDLYAQDYAAMSSLKRLADLHHLAVVVVHHLRKSGSASEDPLEELSGTTGISGAADNVLILKRPRTEDEGTLTVVGRDIEETEHAIHFDRSMGLWTITGRSADVRLSRERSEIVSLLGNSPDAMSPTEIAQLVNKPMASVRRLLHEMYCSGQVTKVGRGKYTAFRH